MQAVTVDFEARRLSAREIREPEAPRENEVLLRVHQVGVCGTDRELASMRIIQPPPGESFLVLGHEALAQVEATGPGVRDLRRGDWVAPMVRRPCAPLCRACAGGRSDLCLTGRYSERGIVAAHGYFRKFALDDTAYVRRVAPEVVDVAILVEPLSVVEKAVEAAISAHGKFFAFEPPRALILGAGAIGILAALALRSRGYDVAVWSQEPQDHPRVRLLHGAGIRYELRPADIVIEATGSAEATVRGLTSLARDGVLMALGAPNATIAFPFRDLIVRNQAVLGSVNATPESFARAIDDLELFDRSILRRIIHTVAFGDFVQTILGPLTPYPKLVHVIE